MSANTVLRAALRLANRLFGATNVGVQIGWAAALCVVATTCAAYLSRIRYNSEVSFHFDEACSWKISQFAWSETLEAVSRDAHPPLYYILLKLFGRLGPANPAILRGCSALLGAATSLVTFRFVRCAASWSDDGPAQDCRRSAVGTALLAALLVGIAPLQVAMGFQARPYALGILLTLLCAESVLRATGPNERMADWFAFTVASIALSYTHYYCLFSVGAFYISLSGVLVRQLRKHGPGPPARRLFLRIGFSILGVQLAWLPWLPVFLVQRARATRGLWTAGLDWEGICATCWMTIVDGGVVAPTPGWAWAAVIIWLGTVLAAFAFGGRVGRLLALCAGFPLAAAVAYGLTVRNILAPRYLSFAHVCLLLCWAVLIPRIPGWRVRIFVAVSVIAWTGYNCWHHLDSRAGLAAVPGVRSAVDYLQSTRRPGEPVIVGSPFVHPIVQSYAPGDTEIYAAYEGDHRDDLLAGPPLRDFEYRNLDRLFHQRPSRVWVIEVLDPIRRTAHFQVEIPQGWKRVHRKEFRESYTFECILSVGEYRRLVDDGS